MPSLEDLPHPREEIQRYQNWRLPNEMVYSPPSSKPKTIALKLAKEKSIPDWRMGSPAFHCSL